MTKGTFLFLGTGSSLGVPVIGCPCEVCHSLSPFNKRLRPSALIKVSHKAFLIDTSPDFREQALQHKIHHIDGVFLTHTHYDHIGGIDDLRIFYFMQKRKLPCVVSKETFKELTQRYHYMMNAPKEHTSVSSQLDFHILEDDFGKSKMETVPFSYVSFYQNEMKVTGYVIGNLAYISDIREYNEELIEALIGTEILIISAAREATSRMHFSLEEAIQFALKIKAKKTYFTHISHEIDHEKIARTLPEGFSLAYDGLEIGFSL